MEHLKWIILCWMVVVLTVNTSCSHDMYDEDKAKEVTDSLSPVDSVDQYHTWQLSLTAAVNVTADLSVGAKKVRILTADPLQSSEAEVAAQKDISDGETTYLCFSYPKRLNTLYAALVDEEELYTVTAFDPASQTTIDFSAPLYSSQKLPYTPQPQTFVYLFEEETPNILTADFDYNDVVLHIALERTGQREVRFHVKLAAVGAKYQTAAAIHLKNYKYEDVESVSTINNASFNVTNGQELPDQALLVLQERTLLLKGMENEEAVINLFSDAHWATGDILTENYGQIQRKLYNVTKGSSTSATTMTPREITYIVTFKEGIDLDDLTFDLVDPFIIKEYNGGKVEVHPFGYRNSPVLYSYTIPDIGRLPWSLVVPYKHFRHPLDGVNIGFIKGDIIGFGAYGFAGHSFGQWSKNRNVAQDWYLNEYATENMVY